MLGKSVPGREDRVCTESGGQRGGGESGHPGGREEGQGQQRFLSRRLRACEGWR